MFCYGQLDCYYNNILTRIYFNKVAMRVLMLAIAVCAIIFMPLLKTSGLACLSSIKLNYPATISKMIQFYKSLS